MTRRERNLWFFVGLAICIAFVYYLWDNRNAGIGDNALPSGASETLNLASAYRLLRAEQNVIRRQKAVAAFRAGIESYFLGDRDPEAARLALLKFIEDLAGKAGLAVEQKSFTALKNDSIAVSLEGKATPGALIRFLQLIGDDRARIDLEIKRLRIHALPEQKLLNYQLLIATLLISKKGLSNGG